ncbi:MAG: energy transducer TonB [Amphritea sp.]|nr:energy transducer TonB [Amphritea sp.]
MITIAVSAVAHAALIGGWLLSTQAPYVGGQMLTVSVSAAGSDSHIDAANAVVNDRPIEPADVAATQSVPDQVDNKPSEQSTVQPAHAVTQPKLESIEQQSEQVKEKPRLKPSKPVHSAIPVSEKATLDKVALAQQVIEKPVSQAKSVVNNAANQVNTSETKPVSPDDLGAQGAPLYQSQPQYLTPPQPPKYPRLARKRGIEGRVLLHVVIDRQGGVTALSVERSSGSALLDRAARKAVQRWQFVPARQNGVAVASYVRVPIDFVLEKH